MTAIAHDVRVRRCTLTIRRRDGWSWGAGPEPYLEAALASLEAALAAAVAESGLEPGAAVVLETPVRLELGGHGDVARASVAALAGSLRDAAASTPPEPDAPSPAADAVPETGDESLALAGKGAAPAPGTEALARTLGRWSRTGRLAAAVRRWPPELVRAWIAAIAAGARDAPTGAEPATLPAAAVERIAETILGDAPAEQAEPRASESVRLLVLLAALIAALDDRLPDTPTQALAAERAAVAAPAANETAVATAPSSRVGDDAGEARRRITVPAGRVELVAPALPLLVLAELERIGYIDAMVAAAAVAGVPEGAAVLAAALAGKVLPPADPDFDRGPALVAASGLASESVAGALEALAADEHVLAPPLAAWLLTAYADGRSSGDELLVTEHAGTLVCGEARGLLPAAWVAGEAELDAALDALGRPPTRRTDAFAALARALDDRPGLPGADALERHLGAAVGTALGLLALDLWGDGGGALLALERLGDLEARVRIEGDRVLAAIPRGQRWLDLQAAGRLAFAHLPWLAGGRLEIGTW